jgi:hypothetical protein
MSRVFFDSGVSLDGFLAGENRAQTELKRARRST